MIELNKIENITDSYHVYKVYHQKNGDKYNIYLGNISKIDNNQLCFQFATDAACWDAETLIQLGEKLNNLNK